MGVLDGCGSYSGQLNEIAKNIYAQKVKNGEPIDNNEKVNIDNDIFEGYQAILGVARDGGEIAEAVNELLRKVSSGQVLNNFSGVASEVAHNVVQKNIETKEYMENTLKTFGTMAAVTTGAGVAVIGTELISTVSLDDHLKNAEEAISTFFGQGTEKEKNEESFELAKSGDEMEKAKFQVLKVASTIMGRFPNGSINQNAMRYALWNIYNAYKLGDPKTIEVAEKMAEHFNIDIFEKDDEANTLVDENGKKIISESKVIENMKKVLGNEKTERYVENWNDRETAIHKMSESIGSSRILSESDDLKEMVDKLGKSIKHMALTDRINEAVVMENFEELKNIHNMDKEFYMKRMNDSMEGYNNDHNFDALKKVQILGKAICVAEKSPNIISNEIVPNKMANKGEKNKMFNDKLENDFVEF